MTSSYSETRSRSSCGLPMIVAQQTTKAFTAFDLPSPVFVRWCLYESPAKALMWALTIAMTKCSERICTKKH